MNPIKKIVAVWAKPFRRLAGSVLLLCYKLIWLWGYFKAHRPSAQRQLKAEADLIRQKAREWGDCFYPVLLAGVDECPDCGNIVGLLVNLKDDDVEKSLCGPCWLSLFLDQVKEHNLWEKAKQIGEELGVDFVQLYGEPPFVFLAASAKAKEIANNRYIQCDSEEGVRDVLNFMEEEGLTVRRVCTQ